MCIATLDDSGINKQYLVSALGIVVFIFLLGNLIDQEQFPIVEDWYMTDLLFLIVPVLVILLGIRLIIRYRIQGNHSIAWILFTLAIIVWYAGEITYTYDVEYDVQDISTLTSDLLWIMGYPLFFGFAVFYLKPFRQAISKNTIFGALLVSSLFVIPTLYFTFVDSGDLSEISLFIYAIYPILDTIILIPSLIAIILFFKGKINSLWVLVLLATVVDIVADTGFLLFDIENFYYPGHPIDILYVWSYILYMFGTISIYNIIKRVKQ